MCRDKGPYERAGDVERKGGADWRSLAATAIMANNSLSDCQRSLFGGPRAATLPPPPSSLPLMPFSSSVSRGASCTGCHEKFRRCPDVPNSSSRPGNLGDLNSLISLRSPECTWVASRGNYISRGLTTFDAQLTRRVRVSSSATAMSPDV